MNDRTIKILAAMARRVPMRLIEQACADQKTIGTARLSMYAEKAGDEIAEYAHCIRLQYEADRAALAAKDARIAELEGEAVEANRELEARMDALRLALKKIRDLQDTAQQHAEYCGVKIVEDPNMAPGSMKLVQPATPSEDGGEVPVEYQQLSRYGNWDRIEKDVFDLGLIGATPDRFRALYAAPVQHSRIVAAKDAEIAMLKEQLAQGGDLIVEFMEEIDQLRAKVCVQMASEPVAYTTQGMLNIAKELPITGRIGAKVKSDERWNVPLYTSAPKVSSPDGAERIAFVLRQIGSMDADDVTGDDVDLRFEDADGRETGCDVSIVEYAEKAADLIEAMIAQPARQVGDDWPKLDKPAKVGGGRFNVGVSARLVVEAAQRQYEYDVTPEKEAERIAKASGFLGILHGALQNCGDERDAFEAAYSSEYGTPISVLRLMREGGAYIEKPRHSDRLNSSWWMWRKARAALAPAAVAVVIPAQCTDRNQHVKYRGGWNNCLSEVTRLNRRAIPVELLERVAFEVIGLEIASGLNADATDELRALLGKD